MRPISTERKEIRTINGNLSEEPERQKKLVMAGGPRQAYNGVSIGFNATPLHRRICLLPKRDLLSQLWNNL
jgi:hypothetical protein